jgi:Tfp pilus assembly protein FimT
MRPQTASHGFTLLEIMIVLFLIMIIGGFSLLSVRNIMPGMRVDRASSRLAFQLQLARSEAIANNQTVFINLNPQSNQFSVWVDTNRNEVRDPGEVSEVLLAEPRLVSLQTDWEDGMFNAFGQFITVPGQREMRTVSTLFQGRGGNKSIELTLRGSGAITKR